ncbi:MAG: aminoacyl-tRNA hydrolase [bacterium]|nr:aminoacyl-tRNA hydrolase [bacterium]
MTVPRDGEDTNLDGERAIHINERLSIPLDEVEFTASRSSGPGGQHVNKVASRVTLQFDVGASPTLDDEQKSRIRRRLATRINREGILKLHVQLHRSQSANRRVAQERFAAILEEALRRRRPRKRTRPTKASRERRLNTKRRRSEVKRTRSGSGHED